MPALYRDHVQTPASHNNINKYNFIQITEENKLLFYLRGGFIFVADIHLVESVMYETRRHVAESEQRKKGGKENTVMGPNESQTETTLAGLSSWIKPGRVSLYKQWRVADFMYTPSGYMMCFR